MYRQNLSEISACEVCGSERLLDVLDLGAHPLCDDLLPVGSDARCEEYPIEILFCETCKTAHQRFQVTKTVLFPKTYHYRARFTADVLNGMKGLVAAVEQTVGSLDKKLVLDIGCNDGSLLGFFREKGAKTVGLEPTGAAEDARSAGHRVINDYLGPSSAELVVEKFGKPDIVTFTNVFAHISNLQEIIQSLKTLLSEDTMVVIENHYLGSVLDGGQFDTFYHEHPRTYSFGSFDFIARSLGLRIDLVEFPARYGGNIRVFMQPARQTGPLLETVDESDYRGKFERLGQFVPVWRQRKRAEIAELVNRYGPLPAKAFPGRAAILVKLLELDVDQVSATYERPGSIKIGNYVPGTRIPIRSEDEFFAENSSPILLNFAWHISDEIEGYMRQRGYAGRIVNILDRLDLIELSRAGSIGV